MRQLYIDGKPAVIKSGTSFKFYRENIYFTEAEDYTLDVTLPLQGCPENLAIFSAIHRPEMSAVHLIGKKYPFHFIAPPLDIEGSAIVTEINEVEVKVQLLAGATGIQYADNNLPGGDAYIDELELGKGFDITKDATDYGYDNYNGTWVLGTLAEDVDTESPYDSNPDRCVCFPVYSEGSDEILNERFYRTDDSVGSYKVTYATNKFSAQPYLLLIIERVLEAIGYTLDPDNPIAKSWQRNLFIVNGRNEYKYANILPHWTVNEFLKEVSMFCGVFFIRSGSVIKAVRKAEYYSEQADTIVLTEVIDEYTTNIAEEEEGSDDVRTANVGYDFESIDPMLQLPDEVWQKAVVIEPFHNETAMYQWANENIKTKEESKWLLSEKQNHGVYAYIEASDGFFLCEVDQMGAIYRDAKRRETDVHLRIVPAKMVMKPTNYYGYIGGELKYGKNAPFHVPVLMTSDTLDRRSDYFSVNNAVNPNATNDSVAPRERIEVAYNDGGQIDLGNYSPESGYSVKVQIPLPTGIPFVRESESYFRVLFTNTNGHRLLLLKQGIEGGMYDILSEGAKIDTRCCHSFQFLDNIEFNPKAIYIIKGRKYACQKIEYNCEGQGVSPIKRGYFYEIND